MHSPTPISIAIVDDHPIFRKSLHRFLAATGFTVAFEAAHGRQLLQELEKGTKPPDICLLDINMPVMDGHEVARQLRRNYPTIKIIAYSYDEHNRKELILQSGAHRFVSKDGLPDELVTTIVSLFNSREAH